MRLLICLILSITCGTALAVDPFEMLEKELDDAYGKVEKKKPSSKKSKTRSSKTKSKSKSKSKKEKPTLKSRIEKLEALLRKKPTHLPLRQELARLYLKDKRFKECIHLLKQDSDRLSKKGLLTLAQAYEQTNKLKEMIQILGVYINAGHTDHQIYTLLGEAHRRMKNPTVAIASFKAAIGIKVNHMPAWNGLIHTFKDTKNTYELTIVFNDMIKLLGPKDIALNELCRLNTENGFIDKAKVYCQEAIQRSPKKPENHIYLGMAMIDSGNALQGSRIIKQTAKQFQNSELAQWKAGDLSETEANYAGASRYYLQATKADTKSARGFLGFARTTFELQNYEKAYDAFFQACKLDKTKTQNFKTAGKRLRNEGHLKLYAKYKSGVGICLLKKPVLIAPDVSYEPMWEEVN